MKAFRGPDRTRLIVGIALMCVSAVGLVWLVARGGWVSLLWFALVWVVLELLWRVRRWADRRDRREATNDDDDAFRRAFTDGAA